LLLSADLPTPGKQRKTQDENQDSAEWKGSEKGGENG